jgi:release factor glutamine methyltransferase
LSAFHGDLFAECRTIAQAAAALNALLREAGIEEYDSDSRQLACAAFGIAHIDLILRPDKEVEQTERARLAAFARRRLDREPVTRILGTRGFWSLELTVRPNVLDPRPDSEIVVEACLDTLGGRVREPLNILDVGTGSGALIAALLTECPLARGWAVDLSADAVAAATHNLECLGLANRSEVLQQSWAEPLLEKFDLVVSNPPYIEKDRLAELDPEVREFDPCLALDGGVDGLDAYRAIAERRTLWLKPGGLLAVEIGATQAASVQSIFEASGAQLVQLRRDYAGRDRAMVWQGLIV